MALTLVSLSFDANDPDRLAAFWADALGWELADRVVDEIRVDPTDGTRFGLRFVADPTPKTEKNPIHLDLLGESIEDQHAVVDRLRGLGAEPVDIGQAGDETWSVLADPEGNELCVVRRGQFLADAPFLSSVIFEPGLPATCRFWAAAIGWPVVFDEDDETAIRAPDGQGPFITFGPPAPNTTGPGRLHLDVAPTVDGDQQSEVARLLGLGATTAAAEDPRWVTLVDLNGNELRVLPGPDP
jgi:catechol 2,3-dioxygenase-like lactoylglutathione lyase family enzyme